MNGLEMKYFVLKPKGSLDDPYAVAARAALRAYANAIKHHNLQLWLDLRNWADREVRDNE